MCKRIFKSFAMIALALTAVFGVLAGCNDKTPENLLTFEVAAEVEATYGTYYVLEEVAGEDTNGNTYFPAVKITDSENNEISVEDGKFFVGSMAGYKITYSIEFGNETVVKETAVKVFDKTKPTIKLAREVELVRVGEDYRIPAAEISDDLDEDEDITVSYSVSFGGNKVEVTEGAFRPSAVGDYTVKYTATDKAGNVAEKTLTVSAVNEEGNVMYFNHKLGASNAKFDGYTGAISDEQTYGDDEYALQLTHGYASNPSAVEAFTGSVTLENPFIKDVSEENLVYFYAYAPNVSFDVYIDNPVTAISDSKTIWESKVHVSRGVWTRIVIENDGQGTFSMGNADVMSAAHKIKSNDITGLGIRFLIQKADNPDSVDNIGCIYMSTLRVAESLPTAKVTLSVGVVFPNDEITLPAPTIDGYDGSTTYKTYISKDGGSFSEIQGSAYTPTVVGNYTVRYEVYGDGKLLDTVAGSFAVTEKEDGVIAYLHRNFGKATVTAGDGINDMHNDSNYVVEGEENSLYFDVTYWPDLKISKPAIKDLNEKEGSEYKYNYVYFWIRTNQNGVSVGLNNHGGATVLKKDEWVRVVATRDGETFKMNGIEIFGQNTNPGKNYPATVTDITDFALAFNAEGFSAAIWLGSIRAVKTLPTIEKTFENSYAKDTPIDVSATATGATVKVFRKNGETLTEYTENTFTATEYGAYTFVYKAYVGDLLVDYAERVVAVLDMTNVVAPFNYGFGADCLNFPATHKGEISKDHTYNGEENSLKITPMGEAISTYDNPEYGYAAGQIFFNDKVSASEIPVGGNLYFYVYSPNVTVRIYGETGSTEWGNSCITVQKGVWTRINVFRNNETNWWMGETGLLGNGSSLNANSIIGLGFRVNILKGDNAGVAGNQIGSIYFSAIRITADNPPPDAVNP